MTAERRPFPLLTALAAAAAIGYGAYHIREVLLPFLLSFALAYIVNPLINAAQTRGLRRFPIILGFYLLVAFGLYILVQYLIPLITTEIAHLQANAPLYFNQTRKLAVTLQLRLSRHFPHQAAPAIESLAAQICAPVLSQLQHIPSYLLGLFPLLSLFFLVPFITFFLLLDGPDIISGLIQACPSRYVEQALHLISEIDTSLGKYLRGILIVALAITAASVVGLWALGVNYALAIAILCGVSSFVPYLGAIMGALVGGGVAFFQFGTFTAFLKVVLLFCLIRLADEAFLQPLIAKRSMHLHPLVFLLSLMIGGELFGFIGLVFAVPAACVIKALLKVLWEWSLSQARLTGHETGAGVAIPYT